VRYQGLDRKELHLSTLHTAGEAKGADQMGFAGTAVAHQKNVLLAIQIFTGHEFSNQLLIDGWLKTEVKRIKRLYDWEPGALDSSFGSSVLTIQRFSFHQTKQKRAVITTFLHADGCHSLIFPKYGGQLELLEVMSQ